MKWFRKGFYKYSFWLLIALIFYCLSILTSKYNVYQSSPNVVQEHIQQLLIEREKRFDEIISDTTFIQSTLKDASGANELTDKEQFGIFIYAINDKKQPELNYWNSNKYYINKDDLNKCDGIYCVTYQNGTFELIKKTIEINHAHCIAFAIIPLRWQYFIRNKYLQNDFDSYTGLTDQYEIGVVNGLPIKSISGQVIFYIKNKQVVSSANTDVITLVLKMVALLYVFIFLDTITIQIIRKKGFSFGFGILVIALVSLRWWIYKYPYPFYFREFKLFDPSVYASNRYLPSLGDLIINTLLGGWLVMFYNKNKKKAFTKQSSNIKAKTISIISLLLIISLGVIFYYIIKSLVKDSNVSFDVTNFYNLDVYSFVCFVEMCLLVFLYYQVSCILIKLITINGSTIYFQWLIVLIIFVVSFLVCLINRKPFDGIWICFLIWILGYIGLLNYSLKDLNKPVLQSAYFIIWSIFLTVSITGIVIYENSSVEFQRRERIAEKLSQQADPSGESLLNIATSNFTDKFLFDNYHRFFNESVNKQLKDSLIRENFSGYLNKYETKMYTFDSLYEPLYNEDTLSYLTIKNLITSNGFPAGIDGLYSYKSNSDKINYLFNKTISNDKTVLGYLFVLVKPKRYKNESLYPELFKQVQDISTDLNTNYAYAIYYHEKLVYHFNDYSFPSKVDVPFKTNKYVTRENHGFKELWYQGENDRQVVVVKEQQELLEMVTLFAYLFCIFLLLVFLIHASQIVLRTGFRLKRILFFFRLNIRSQIHFTILFISIFSFVVIGVATVFFFTARFNKNNVEKLSNSIHVIEAELENDVRSQLVFDDELTEKDLANSIQIEKKIGEISEIHNVDVNFFDNKGNLKVSTQPYIFNKHLLNEKMHPQAYYALTQGKSVEFIQQESIGSLTFLSIYIPLKDDGGNVYAYLNIPYLNSQAQLNQEVSGFLATLLNLNAFIFLIAGAIAFIVANRITTSFKLIGDRMKGVNLGKVNEAIEWNKKDEIGVLVNEYNKMVNKLDESAKALARSEREGAWREMARQVAHEIKNPLTPMKLSIQYLQKTIEDGLPNSKDLTSKTAAMLIEQIDQLARIAGDFNQFANIAMVHPQEFSIGEVIDTLVQLYSNNDKFKIIWKNERYNNVLIKADKVQITRMLTNLIKNATESFGEMSNGIIEIVQTVEKDSTYIYIIDNGKGISSEVREKIFTPNFTTKSSGTGLGLAICKGIVEKANGVITFKSEVGKGTTFCVSLPIAGYKNIKS